jgi:hypothetical protein
MAIFVTRLRQSWEEELRQRGPEQCSLASPPPSSPKRGEPADARPGSRSAGRVGAWVRLPWPAFAGVTVTGCKHVHYFGRTLNFNRFNTGRFKHAQE